MDTRPIPLRPDRDAVRDAAVLSLTRAAVAIGAKAISRNPGNDALGDDRTAQLIFRAAVSPTSTASAGAALVAVTQAFLAELTPVSAGAVLFARGLQLAFDRNAAIVCPTLEPALVGLVGEGQPIPVRQFAAEAPVLYPYKLAGIAALTSEVLQAANAEALTRAALVESVGPSLDLVLFDDAPVIPQVRPAGLLNGVAPLPSSGDMLDDLVTLATAVGAIAGDDIVFVADPDSAASIRILSPKEFPYDLLASSALAPGSVIAIAPRAVASAAGAPEIDASRQGVVHFEDTLPAPIVDGEGVPARPTASLFQADLVGLRLRLTLGWVLRSRAAIAWMHGVEWGLAVAPASSPAQSSRARHDRQ
jgi:hypothetical protein